MKIKLNWPAYFQEFCQAHGGDPLVYLADKETGLGGYLLFSDGWLYGRQDPSGPEYPPLSQEDALLKSKYYWTARAGILKTAMIELAETIRQLALRQDAHSAPLVQQLAFSTEDEAGQRVRRVTSEKLDFQALLADLRGLLAAYQECRQRLANPEIQLAPVQRPESAKVLAELDLIYKEISHGSRASDPGLSGMQTRPPQTTPARS